MHSAARAGFSLSQCLDGAEHFQVGFYMFCIWQDIQLWLFRVVARGQPGAPGARAADMYSTSSRGSSL
jgi:hypothetical protein